MTNIFNLQPYLDNLIQISIQAKSMFYECIIKPGRLRFMELLIGSYFPTDSDSFSRLDLPPYPSEEIMCDKLTQAVEETCGFAVEWILVISNIWSYISTFIFTFHNYLYNNELSTVYTT